MNISVKERPILFSAPMVRAILDGRKKQTRRVVKFKKKIGVLNNDEFLMLCPHGKRGDRLWVRESFLQDSGGFIYRADGDFEGNAKILGGWRPSIFMPRWASRILLEITNVRVERINDISEEDAIAEGVDGEKEAAAIGSTWYDKPRRAYRRIWESINGQGSWDLNPFVWVIEFKVVK